MLGARLVEKTEAEFTTSSVVTTVSNTTISVLPANLELTVNLKELAMLRYKA